MKHHLAVLATLSVVALAGCTVAPPPSVETVPTFYQRLDQGAALDEAAALDMIVSGDLLIHTWDLARATGLDEELDAGEVHRMYVGIQPMDQVLRESGHYGPRVPVADDASEQARLLAFTGRQP